MTQARRRLLRMGTWVLALALIVLAVWLVRAGDGWFVAHGLIAGAICGALASRVGRGGPRRGAFVISVLPWFLFAFPAMVMIQTLGAPTHFLWTAALYLGVFLVALSFSRWGAGTPPSAGVDTVFE